MVRIRTALAIGAALAATACATGYGPHTLGGGYSDDRVDDSRYRVKFQGNGYASQDRVWNFWIYRCAELTKQDGFTHFALQKPSQPQVLAPQPAPSQPAHSQPAAHREEGNRLESGADDAPRMLRTKGGGVTYVPIYVPASTVRTWHSNAIVAMFKEPLPENVTVLKAQTVLDDPDAHIKSNGSATPPPREDLFRRATSTSRPRTSQQSGVPM